MNLPDITDALKQITDSNIQHQYMMLDRLRNDCEYFLGFGNRNEKCLWALNTVKHIEIMKALHNHLEDKPEWLTFDEILDFESKMIVKG